MSGQGWFRKHRWALLALAALAPAAVLASLSVDWFSYADANTQHPVAVAAGEAGVAQGATFTLTDYAVVPWNTDAGRNVGLLEGTEAVSALIHVDATDSSASEENPLGCDAILVAPGAEADRVWRAGSSAIDYYPSGDLTAFCNLGNHEEFDWEAVFVVPEGVGEDARLLITDGSFSERQLLKMEH